MIARRRARIRKSQARTGRITPPGRREGIERVGARPPQLDAVFSALSDGTRRSILARLRDRERTVGELAAPLDMSLPAVSKHLRVLEIAGLLKRRIAGRSHFLKVNPVPLDQAVHWIEQHRRFWEGSFDRLEKLLAAPVRKHTSKSKPNR